jgi:C4-dicarboxylate-specific signal transduction histidine kinase
VPRILAAQFVRRQVVGIEHVPLVLADERVREGADLDAGSALRQDEIQDTLAPIHGAAGITPPAGGSSIAVLT